MEAIDLSSTAIQYCVGAPIYPTALAASSKIKSGEQECSLYTGGTGGLGEEQISRLRQERLGWEGQSIKNKGWVARAGAEARIISAAERGAEAPLFHVG